MSRRGSIRQRKLISGKVKVVNGKDSGGILQIEFYSEEDLSELAAYFDR